MNCILAVMIGSTIGVCIHSDGTVTYKGSIDAASKAFWEEVAKHVPTNECPPIALRALKDKS